MSDSSPSKDRTVVYLLGVVAVLLVVIVGIIIVRSQPAAAPAAATATTEAPTSNQMPGIAPSAGAFDAKTATKVPSGVQPADYVKSYYQAILDKNWEKAFKMQPAASQANGTVADFQSTQTGYGMQSFKVASSSVKGDTAVVTVEQNLGANGNWAAQWTFVKSGNGWVVKERAVSMK
jgi:hypothetical protein